MLVLVLVLPLLWQRLRHLLLERLEVEVVPPRRGASSERGAKGNGALKKKRRRKNEHRQTSLPFQKSKTPFFSNVVDGACYNAGQSCCAIERVYVHRSVHDEFVERARRVLEAYRMGDPLDETTTLGPLAIRTALTFLERQVEDAVAQGAHLLLGGQRVAGTTGNFFPPTLLVDVPNRSSLMQDESFAPILAVRRVQDDEEAIALMRDTRFGLTASVWTDDTDRAERVARELDVGTVFQNRCDYVDPSLPWSGWGESGRGATMSRYGFLALTRRKALHFRQAP